MKKNLIQKGKLITILLFCFLLSACSIDNLGEKIDDLDVKIGKELEKLESGKIESVKEAEVAQEEKQEVKITGDAKKKIEKWIKDNGLNRYGDILGTAYTGGTPLFDEAKNKAIDRYDYIVSQHPELKKILKF